MVIPFFLSLVLLVQTITPYKSEDEFTVKFEFTFSKRGEAGKDDFVLSQAASSTYDRPDNSPLPYVRANLDLLKVVEKEVKLKVIRDNDNQSIKKKIIPAMSLTIFSGFVDDIKDQVSEFNHTVYFLDKEGNQLSKIVIEFDEDGFYLVNGKKKGKLY